MMDHIGFSIALAAFCSVVSSIVAVYWADRSMGRKLAKSIAERGSPILQAEFRRWIAGELKR